MRKYDKKRVAQSFSRAATSYKSAAQFQSRLAKILLTTLKNETSGLALSSNTNSKTEKWEAEQILDLGCGLANERHNLTQSLNHNLTKKHVGKNFIGLDISPTMLFQAKDNSKHLSKSYEENWCCADIEQLPFSNNSFDLVYSNLAIQWCSNLSEVLSNVQRVLNHRGVFAFSTMLKGNFPELNDAWAVVDSQPHINSYPSLEQQQQVIEASDFKLKTIEQHNIQCFFPSFKALIQNLRQTGVNTVFTRDSSSTPLTNTSITTKQYRAIETCYEQFRTAQGLPVTYKTLVVILQL